QIPVGRPTAVLALHGQLAAVAWAFAQSSPSGRLGYVQTEGGALPGGHSRTVRALRARGLLAGHLTAGAASAARGGDDDRGGAPPRLSLARLGRRRVRARARDRGIELRARARRPGGPGLRPRLPRARLPHAARGTHVDER